MAAAPTRPGSRAAGLTLAWGLLAACQPQATPGAGIAAFRGQAMGTYYAMKYVPTAATGDARAIQQQVDAELARFNRVFSTYDPDSEISRFNRHRSTAPFAASAGFRAVVGRALAIARRTGGAFDPTVGPLLRLYGFGPGGKAPAAPPAPAVIAAARQHTGFDKLAVAADGRLTKRVAELELDLNAMAKGTGVDRVAELFDRLGIASYMVEIGGEVRCRGRKPGGAVWRLGVAQPGPDAAGFADQVDLLDRAMATSGSYLQFRQLGDRQVHHILNRQTGANAEHRTVSVTVIAPRCELADALATALMVLGPDAGEAVLDGFAADGVQALFLLAGEQGIERRTYRW